MIPSVLYNAASSSTSELLLLLAIDLNCGAPVLIAAQAAFRKGYGNMLLNMAFPLPDVLYRAVDAMTIVQYMSFLFTLSPE